MAGSLRENRWGGINIMSLALTPDRRLKRNSSDTAAIPKLEVQTPIIEAAQTTSLADIAKDSFNDPLVYQTKHPKDGTYGMCSENTRQLIEKAESAGCDLNTMHVAVIWSRREDHHFLVVPFANLRPEEHISKGDASDFRRWRNHVLLAETDEGVTRAFDLSAPEASLGSELGDHLRKLLSWELQFPDALSGIQLVLIPAQAYLNLRDDTRPLDTLYPAKSLGELLTQNGN